MRSQRGCGLRHPRRPGSSPGGVPGQPSFARTFVRAPSHVVGPDWVHAEGVDKASVLAELARVMARQDGRGALSERLCVAAATIAGASGASLTIAYTSPFRV